ncbi:MAG: hypothetical protein ABI124_05255 [Terrimesophilobacter sp.]
MTTLDYSALSSPVTRQDIIEYRRSGRPGLSSAIPTVTAMVIVIVVGALMFSFTMSAFSGSASESTNLPIVLVVLALVIAAVSSLYVFSQRASWIRLLRVTRFADANGLEYSVAGEVPSYPGSLFGIGSARSVPERISRATAPSIDLGDLRYTTGSGKNRKVHNWGYLAIKLDRMLPQMVLDAKANNFFGTNLPVSFSRSQVLPLEGDFDRFFTLYCPKEYESDALYVFTPDLMARLIDEAANYDVEIVDDWMFLYSASPFDLADAATLARVFRIIDTVGTKTLDRTERYADSRVAVTASASDTVPPLTARMSSNTVAQPGRRLQRGVPLVGILVFVAVVAVIWILNFAPMFSGF